MASDVVLVLQSRHRRLRELAERSRRPARGLADPTAELAREAAGHAAALVDLLAATNDRRLLPSDTITEIETCCAAVAVAAGRDRDRLAPLVERLLDLEGQLLQALPAAHVDQRRRWGRRYRSVAQAAQRSQGGARRHTRATPTRTELYERARRAGVAHRSKMSLSELLEAVSAAEGRGRS
jgi:hypothetical protein